jgi:Cyclic nucleotide-binding domain
MDALTFLGTATESISSVNEALTANYLFDDTVHFRLDSLYTQFRAMAVQNLNFVSFFAFAGILFHVVTPLMRTMVPLRISFIFSDSFFIIYGILAHSYVTLAMYMLLLPINSMRLYQMLRLVRKARASAQGDRSLNWLKPFTTQRKYSKGDVLFRKGDPANEMFFTVTGKFLVVEINVELPPGHLVGELGFLSPDNRRTMSVECAEGGEVLSITYDKLLEICFENPEFGYYFLRVTSARLLQRIAQLESAMTVDRPESKPTTPEPSARPPAVRRPGDDDFLPGLSSWA